MQITLRCPAENRVIGAVDVAADGRLDARAIQSGYEAERGYELGTDVVKDGTQLLCPRCANPVVVSGEDTEIYVVPGMLRIAEGRSADGAAAG